MSDYQVISRRWRPQQFEDIVGQDHIVRTLRNAIESGRIAHAYLFVGPRGTGLPDLAQHFLHALLAGILRQGRERHGQVEAGQDGRRRLEGGFHL